MPLTAGARLGPYEIVSAIGAGGMGEVYRARDTRLDRTVAIKLLGPHLAADPEIRERFEREAKAISSLDHPHICTLYDVGEAPNPGGAAGAESVQFLVMQYLEGETLADRLARGARPKSDPSVRAEAGSDSVLSSSRGPIPIDQALRHATEIAGALDAAHRRGIVHRDLKPGNVMLTKAGVKLLDFGLAKIAGPPVAVSGLTAAATRSSPLTAHGALLGTLQYMAPEQLEGREADARSDIFAFGAMLYEMLTGRRAFESRSQAGVIAAILGAEPPPLADIGEAKAALPAGAHRSLDRLLRKCLAKSPDERWQSAADLADELKWIDEERLRGGAHKETEEKDVAAARTAGLLPGSPRPRERWWMASTAGPQRT